MATRARPMNDRVLIRPAEAETKSKGGILLPDVAKQKPQRGEVLAVGPGRPTEKGDRQLPSVKPGDVVLYCHWAGVGLEAKELDGCLFVREDEILAVLEG